jgi:biotin operon repressor
MGSREAPTTAPTAPQHSSVGGSRVGSTPGHARGHVGHAADAHASPLSRGGEREREVTTVTKPKPVAGPTFRRVAAMNIAGGKRRKVLALIAAYADGGCRPPTTGQLARHLGLSPQKVAALLKRLERDGLVVPTRRGRGRRSPLRYRLPLPNDPPAAAPEHTTATAPARNGNAGPGTTDTTRARAATRTYAARDRDETPT